MPEREKWHAERNRVVSCEHRNDRTQYLMPILDLESVFMWRKAHVEQ